MDKLVEIADFFDIETLEILAKRGIELVCQDGKVYRVVKER